MLDNKIIKTYAVGIIAPRTFNDLTVLQELLADKLQFVSHINTNNVVAGGETVQSYAKHLGIPLTIYPVKSTVGGILISNTNIIQESEFIFILDDGESKNTELAKDICEKRTKKFKIVQFTPLPTKQPELLKAVLEIKTFINELIEEFENPSISKKDVIKRLEKMENILK